MNTKQKLTLGIAAIFMVTLTIVGVTYAYFVTQVQTGTQAEVEVTTATFGEVEFVKEGDSVTLNSMADDDTESLNFSVKNTGENDLSYDLVLRHTGGDKFIKSLTSAEAQPLATCYNLADDKLDEAPEACFTGSYYDNVSIVITRYTDEARTQGATEVYNGKLMVKSPEDIQENISISTGANSTHYYTITVTHDDSGKNQNLETEAVVTVIPDIASIG